MKTDPFIRTGTSANLTTYQEHVRGLTGRPGGLWAEVIRNDYQRGSNGIGLVRLKVPAFSFRVYQDTGAIGFGRHRLVAEFLYAPSSRPKTERLSNRTVTMQVRKHVATLPDREPS